MGLCNSNNLTVSALFRVSLLFVWLFGLFMPGSNNMRTDRKFSSYNIVMKNILHIYTVMKSGHIVMKKL